MRLAATAGPDNVIRGLATNNNNNSNNSNSGDNDNVKGEGGDGEDESLIEGIHYYVREESLHLSICLSVLSNLSLSICLYILSYPVSSHLISFLPDLRRIQGNVPMGVCGSIWKHHNR